MIDGNGLVHLAVRTERVAAEAHWAKHQRATLLLIADQLRQIAREHRSSETTNGN